MKKKTQSTSEDFKMPHLFREDLEEIENILKEISPREYKLESQNFEYTNIKEIPKDLDAINEFHIQAYPPYISIDFNTNGARIYAGDDDIKTMGGIKKIADIISKRERKHLWHLSRLANWFAPILIWIPVYLVMFVDEETVKPNKILIFSSVLLSLIGIIWFIVGFRLKLYNFSLIEFTYKKEKLNFFMRNRDRIIVGIIIAIVSVLLTLLFQKIFK